MAGKSFRGYVATLAVCGDQVQAGKQSTQDALESCIAWIRDVRDRQSVVHLLGNGGSAAVVSHAQNDLVKGCKVQALVHQDIPTLTAYTNDNGYEASLRGPLAVWLQRQDVVIAVSSAGQSPNIVQAATAAKEKGAQVITLSGFLPENALRQLGHVNFYVPSTDYGSVELTHAALLHYLTDRLADAG
jgi:D-sedoheptulose 7-phosphate isomerase